MTAIVGEPIWRAIARSSRGAAHLRTGLPNQDAFAIWPESGEGPPLILVVSDGHGAKQHFRSDVGARLATEVAVARLREFLEVPPDAGAFAEASRTLPRRLVEAWREAVRSHLAAHPITNEELKRVDKESFATLQSAAEQDPYFAYGATLLASVMHQDALLYLQLGDGDILAVAETGETWRPLPEDALLVANRTTSLCQPQAWEAMRVCAEIAPERRPALILASTDGYSNSFKADDDFLQIGRDYLQLVRKDGIATIAGELAGFLADASKHGSGDDVTLGLAARVTGSTDNEEHMGELANRVAALEKGIREVNAGIRAGRIRQTVSLVCSLLALAAALFVMFSLPDKPNPGRRPIGLQPTVAQPKKPVSGTAGSSGSVPRPD